MTCIGVAGCGLAGAGVAGSGATGSGLDSADLGLSKAGDGPGSGCCPTGSTSGISGTGGIETAVIRSGMLAGGGVTGWGSDDGDASAGGAAGAISTVWSGGVAATKADVTTKTARNPRLTGMLRSRRSATGPFQIHQLQLFNHKGKTVRTLSR